MAFRTDRGRVIDRVAIGARGAMMAEAASPAAGVGVVKIRIPIDRGMALGTIGAEELPGMRGWLGVAGNAVGWRASEDIIGVTAGACQANVRAGQRKGRVSQVIV